MSRRLIVFLAAMLIVMAFTATTAFALPSSPGNSGGKASQGDAGFAVAFAKAGGTE